MPRIPRIAPIDIPQHVIQRGNNHQACFTSEADMKAYANWLKEYAQKYCVDVHAWVFMTNHTHLLCTPKQPMAISKMMQSIGRMYVGYYNDIHQRSGTLWEGRFKSCLVENDHYLLELYRYIELNPVRANMVASPADYSWSSYQCNGLGKTSDLLTPHPLFTALGNCDPDRQTVYRSLFASAIAQECLDTIRKSTNSGMAIGSDQFKQEIEQLTGKRVTARKSGRPRCSEIQG